jgi:hypothetical protein
MDEEHAKAVAEALGGETWQSGGDIWLVILRRTDGRLVVISDEVLAEYKDESAFDSNKPAARILLQ